MSRTYDSFEQSGIKRDGRGRRNIDARDSNTKHSQFSARTTVRNDVRNVRYCTDHTDRHNNTSNDYTYGTEERKIYTETWQGGQQSYCDGHQIRFANNRTAGRMFYQENVYKVNTGGPFGTVGREVENSNSSWAINMRVAYTGWRVMQEANSQLIGMGLEPLEPGESICWDRRDVSDLNAYAPKW